MYRPGVAFLDPRVSIVGSKAMADSLRTRRGGGVMPPG
jgi:hypothetical protein